MPPVQIFAKLFGSAVSALARANPGKLGRVFETLSGILSAKKLTEQLIQHLAKMGGQQSRDQSKGISKDQFTAMSNNVNNIIDIQKRNHLEDEFSSELPFHTDTIFLMLIVGLVVLGVILVSMMVAKYSHARKESRPQRAARTLNIEAGGIGAPKHVITSMPLHQV